VLEVWVEASCDESGHVESLADVGASASDMLPSARIAPSVLAKSLGAVLLARLK
jgi:hypothetical protein